LKLVEQHVIRKSDSRFKAIDCSAFLAKNLYNLANYHVRQHFFSTGHPLSLKQLYSVVKDSSDYQALPRKVSQLVLINLLRCWKSYFEAKKAYNLDPSKFYSCPRIPKYKDKQKGRYLLTYNSQAISRSALIEGVIKPSGLEILIKTKQTKVLEVRIVPKKTHYIVEVVYEKELEKKVDVDPSLLAGVDIGLNNLAAVASNKPGFVPLLVNGRPLKSINQYYNKRKADLQSRLKDPKSGTGEQTREEPLHSFCLPSSQGTSKKIERLTLKRNHRIHHQLHLASRWIVDHLVRERIGTLVIGKNDNWKQSINHGKRNNQNFVSVPHARFVQMLTYKAKLSGISVVITEESYTSKCSFLDFEAIENHLNYMGHRVKRGLFRAATGRFINADLNGALNIIRKVAPNAFSHGVEGVVVHPVKVGIWNSEFGIEKQLEIRDF